MFQIEMKHHVAGHVVHGVIALAKAGLTGHVVRPARVDVGGSVDIGNAALPARSAAGHAHVDPVGYLGEGRPRDCANTNHVGFRGLRLMGRADLVSDRFESNRRPAGREGLTFRLARGGRIVPPLVGAGPGTEVCNVVANHRRCGRAGRHGRGAGRSGGECESCCRDGEKQEGTGWRRWWRHAAAWIVLPAVAAGGSGGGFGHHHVIDGCGLDLGSGSRRGASESKGAGG